MHCLSFAFAKFPVLLNIKLAISSSSSLSTPVVWRWLLRVRTLSPPPPFLSRLMKAFLTLAKLAYFLSLNSFLASSSCYCISFLRSFSYRMLKEDALLMSRFERRFFEKKAPVPREEPPPIPLFFKAEPCLLLPGLSKADGVKLARFI